MIEYYLKFLPSSKIQFQRKTKPESDMWVRHTLWRFVTYGWAIRKNNRYHITELGQKVYDDYLGVK